MIQAHVTKEQLRDPTVHDAKLEGMMCPALIELVCEMLGCSGRDPDGTGCLSDALWARTRMAKHASASLRPQDPHPGARSCPGCITACPQCAKEQQELARLKQEVVHQQQADCGCMLEDFYTVPLLPLLDPSPLPLCALCPC